MATLAPRTAVRWSILLDCRDANVAIMDSRAVRFFEVDATGELSEETDADADFYAGAAIAGLEDEMGGGGGHEVHRARRGGR